MESKSKLQIALDSLEGLTKSELRQVERHALSRRLDLSTSDQHRLQRPRTHSAIQRTSHLSGNYHNAHTSSDEPRAAQLVQLPIDLRFMIYELVVTPGMAEAHVKKNKIPALLQVNRETRDDFASYYYGRKVFRAELFTDPTSMWEEVINPVRVQALFEGWLCCYADDELQAISERKAFVEELHGGSIDNSSKEGILTWIGAQNRMGVQCSLWEDTSHDKARPSREEQLAYMHECQKRRDAKREAEADKIATSTSVPKSAVGLD